MHTNETSGENIDEQHVILQPTKAIKSSAQTNEPKIQGTHHSIPQPWTRLVN